MVVVIIKIVKLIVIDSYITIKNRDNKKKLLKKN